jgi:hypothetical protein
MAPRRHGPAAGHAYPHNQRRTYLGDVRAAPIAVMEGGEPATPYLGLWVDAETGLVVSTLVALERPAEALAEALLDPTSAPAAAPADPDDAAAGTLTAVDAYELPGRAVVFDPVLAAALRPRLAGRGIALEVSERIDAFEELFDSLFAHMAGAASPPQLEMPDEVLAPLCGAADRLWQAKPWRYCYDEPPIGVEPLNGRTAPVYAVVLGRGGEVFGVALYSSLEDYEALADLDEPPPVEATAASVAFGEALEAAHRHRTYLVSFDEKAEVDPHHVERVVAAGWSRRRRVVPSFMAHGGGQPTALFGAAEARRLGPVLDAVTAFCQQARDRIAELEYLPIQLAAEVAVEAAGETLRFRMTMPPDVPAARRRGRRPSSKAASARPPAGGAAGARTRGGGTAEPRTSIDDPAVAADLIAAMRPHLPIAASPTPELARSLRPGGLKVGPGRALFIRNLYYMGDEGGICCDVTPSAGAREAFVVSLTHLRIEPTHPLSRPIRAYQRARVRALGVTGR